MTYGIRYLSVIRSLPVRFISGLARVPVINQSGSLIPHFSENNIQTKEEKSNKRKINTLIISLLMKYSYFVKIS